MNLWKLSKLGSAAFLRLWGLRLGRWLPWVHGLFLFDWDLNPDVKMNLLNAWLDRITIHQMDYCVVFSLTFLDSVGVGNLPEVFTGKSSKY